MPLPGESAAPDAVTATDAAVCHASEPPENDAGSVGTVRSIRIVFVAPELAGVHAEVLPALSVVRNWTSVCPSAPTVRLDPALGADHVRPLSSDVRCSMPAKPEPPVSVLPLALTVTEATFCHVVEPPETVGAAGAVRSIRTVLPAPGTAGAQEEVNPATSTARNCTTVSPWAVIRAGLPVAGAPQVTPPSVDVRDW